MQQWRISLEVSIKQERKQSMKTRHTVELKEAEGFQEITSTPLVNLSTFVSVFQRNFDSPEIKTSTSRNTFFG
jgi:hypothetical protein